MKFYIYCQLHRPHRLIKNSEFSKQRCIDDIIYFSDILKKNYEILNKFDKNYDFSVFTPKRYDSGENTKKNLLYSKNEKSKSKIFNYFSQKTTLK